MEAVIEGVLRGSIDPEDASALVAVFIAEAVAVLSCEGCLADCAEAANRLSENLDPQLVSRFAHLECISHKDSLRS